MLSVVLGRGEGPPGESDDHLAHEPEPVTVEHDGQDHHEAHLGHYKGLVHSQCLRIVKAPNKRDCPVIAYVELEDNASEEEDEECCDRVDSVPDASSGFVREEEPADVHERCRYLREKKHDSEDAAEVHEVEGLVESGRCDDVMCVGLVIERGASLHDEEKPYEILRKVAATVEQGPNVHIAHCSDALVTVKDGLAITTDEPHGPDGEDNANESVDN